MILGSIVRIGDAPFVVLACGKDGYAVAPVITHPREKLRAFDVRALGAIVRCAATKIVPHVELTEGYTLDASTVTACQRAAERAASERSLCRFAPLAAFAAAQPSHRSGGRRVGRAPAQ